MARVVWKKPRPCRSRCRRAWITATASVWPGRARPGGERTGRLGWSVGRGRGRAARAGVGRREGGPRDEGRGSGLASWGEVAATLKAPEMQVGRRFFILG